MTVPNKRTEDGARDVQLDTMEDREWLYRKLHRRWGNGLFVIDGDQLPYRMVNREVEFVAVLEMKRADGDINEKFRSSIYEELWVTGSHGLALEKMGQLMKVPVYVVAYLQQEEEINGEGGGVATKYSISKYSVCKLDALKRNRNIVWQVMTPDHYVHWLHQLRGLRKSADAEDIIHHQTICRSNDQGDRAGE